MEKWHPIPLPNLNELKMCTKMNLMCKSLIFFSLFPSHHLLFLTFLPSLFLHSHFPIFIDLIHGDKKEKKNLDRILAVFVFSTGFYIRVFF